MTNTQRHNVFSWLDGHLLGNGDMGAVLWGTGDAVRIGLSKHDINDLRCSAGDEGTRWAQSYPDMQRRVLAGERAFLDDIANVTDLTTGPPAQLAAGCLTLELGRGLPVVAYEQALDMRRATASATVMPTQAGKSWGATFAPIRVEACVLATQNLLHVRLSSACAQTIHWHFNTQPNADLLAPTFALRDGRACMDRQLPRDTGYGAAIEAPGEVHVTPLGVQGCLTFGGDSGDACLLVALVTTFENTAPATAAAAICQQADSAELLRSHRDWWADFWARSSISYDDAAIEALWTTGLYLLGSSTRPGTSPPNLQGIWNQYDNPPWNADFHLNTNVQECQWLACISNHPELQEALVYKLTGDWLPALEAYTRHSFESDGIAVPLCVDWLGRPIGFQQLDLALSMSAWLAWHLWQQWDYTRDTALLRDRVYPFLKAAAQFYFDVLHERDDGLFHIELTQSPEQIRESDDGRRGISYGSDATIDIAFIRTLLGSIEEAATMVEEADTDFLDRCRHVAAHLPDYPTKDGVLIDYASCYFYDGDAPGHFPVSHRHPSRLTPIYPCGEIGMHSPAEDLALGRRSYAEFRSYGAEGFSGWSLSWQAVIAARLGLADDVEARLHEFIDQYLLPNGVASHNPIGSGDEIFQIEAILGAAAAVNEALIQTAGGIVYLFPGVPDQRSASFVDLRIPGGYRVSASKVGPRITTVSIHGDQDGTIRLAHPWPDPGQPAVLEIAYRAPTPHQLFPPATLD